MDKFVWYAGFVNPIRVSLFSSSAAAAAEESLHKMMRDKKSELNLNR